jgi:hypothetical protein
MSLEREIAHFDRAQADLGESLVERREPRVTKDPLNGVRGNLS